MTGIFCIITLLCGVVIGAIIGIVLWEDYKGGNKH